jgi:hypothetical protein
LKSRARQRVLADEQQTAAKRRRAFHSEDRFERLQAAREEWLTQRKPMRLRPFRHRQRKDTGQVLGNGREISIVHGIDQFGALAQPFDSSVRLCVERVEEFAKRRVE